MECNQDYSSPGKASWLGHCCLYADSYKSFQADIDKKRKHVCVYDVKDRWREGDNDDADTWEPWALNDVLYQQIVEY